MPPAWRPGLLRTAAGRRALPIGSRFDPDAGIFTWLPGPGFLGAYDFEFDGPEHRYDVRIIVAPRASSIQAGPQIVIDTPTDGGVAGQPMRIGGCAIDLDDTAGTGVSTIHTWAYPQAGGVPIFLGVAAYGGERQDVAAIFGDRFRGSGYDLVAPPLLPGTYDLAVFPWSTARHTFLPAKVVRVSVR